MINELIDQIIKSINDISGGNQIIAGAISLWVLGTSSYLLRNIPARILRFIKKHTTTTVQFTNDSQAFYYFQSWLHKKNFSAKTRTIRLNNGRWGYGDIVKTVGYGQHILWYKMRPLFFVYSKEQSDSEKTKEFLTVTIPGRNHDIIDDIIENIKGIQKDPNKIKYYESTKDSWCFIGEYPKRKLDSIYIAQDKKQAIIDHINNFLNSEQWYVDNGIPYQLGIILHG